MMSIRLIVALLLAAGSVGFQVDSSKKDFIIAELIHRDSYMSQLDNNSLKSTTLTSSGMILGESTKSNTSLDWINNFNSSTIHDIDARDIESVVTSVEGDYLMKIKIGGQEKLLMLTTTLASTLIFCEPCRGCHAQDAPRLSQANTAKFPGESTECRLLGSYRRVKGNWCCYKREKRGLSTHGVLSRTRSSFGSSSGSGTEGGQFHLWFVCVVTSLSDPLGPSVEGLVGLGPGPYSLITQLARQLKIAKKFSYCFLNPYEKDDKAYSKIIFGEKTSISTEKVTTPFVIDFAQPYYYLSLRAITVGDQGKNGKILMKGHDNMIIVSDIRTTGLPPETYNDLANIIKLFMDDHGGRRVQDDEYNLCYAILFSVSKLPIITLEFDNEAMIKLPLRNTYIVNEPGKVCITIKPTNEGALPMLGTEAQQNLVVEYDLDKSEISLGKADCNKFGIEQ